MKKRIIVINRENKKVYGEPYEENLKSLKYWSTSFQSLEMLQEMLKTKKIYNYLRWYEEEVR